jgi:hypothetical protein
MAILDGDGQSQAQQGESRLTKSHVLNSAVEQRSHPQRMQSPEARLQDNSSDKPPRQLKA